MKPKKRLGRIDRKKPRNEQAVAARLAWEKKTAERWDETSFRHGRDIERIGPYGSLLSPGETPPDDIRGEDVAVGLECALKATGDPIFADALAVLRDYRLADGKPRASYEAARNRAFGDPDLGYLVQMRWFIEHKSASVRAAADDVAAKFCPLGEAFEATTRRLRDAYAEWSKAGFPEETIRDDGDAGYFVLAKPLDGALIPNPFDGMKPLPEEGVVVRFTAFWRCRFEEGSISISRVK